MDQQDQLRSVAAFAASGAALVSLNARRSRGRKALLAKDKLQPDEAKREHLRARFDAAADEQHRLLRDDIVRVVEEERKLDEKGGEGRPALPPALRDLHGVGSNRHLRNSHVQLPPDASGHRRLEERNLGCGAAPAILAQLGRFHGKKGAEFRWALQDVAAAMDAVYPQLSQLYQVKPEEVDPSAGVDPGSLTFTLPVALIRRHAMAEHPEHAYAESVGSDAGAIHLRVRKGFREWVSEADEARSAAADAQQIEWGEWYNPLHGESGGDSAFFTPRWKGDEFVKMPPLEVHEPDRERSEIEGARGTPLEGEYRRFRLSGLIPSHPKFDLRSSLPPLMASMVPPINLLDDVLKQGQHWVQVQWALAHKSATGGAPVAVAWESVKEGAWFEGLADDDDVNSGGGDKREVPAIVSGTRTGGAERVLPAHQNRWADRISKHQHGSRKEVKGSGCMLTPPAEGMLDVLFTTITKRVGEVILPDIREHLESFMRDQSNQMHQERRRVLLEHFARHDVLPAIEHIALELEGKYAVTLCSNPRLLVPLIPKYSDDRSAAIRELVRRIFDVCCKSLDGLEAGLQIADRGAGVTPPILVEGRKPRIVAVSAVAMPERALDGSSGSLRREPPPLRASAAQLRRGLFELTIPATEGGSGARLWQLQVEVKWAGSDSSQVLLMNSDEGATASRQLRCQQIFGEVIHLDDNLSHKPTHGEGSLRMDETTPRSRDAAAELAKDDAEAEKLRSAEVLGSSQAIYVDSCLGPEHAALAKELRYERTAAGEVSAHQIAKDASEPEKRDAQRVRWGFKLPAKKVDSNPPQFNACAPFLELRVADGGADIETIQRDDERLAALEAKDEQALSVAEAAEQAELELSSTHLVQGAKMYLRLTAMEQDAHEDDFLYVRINIAEPEVPQGSPRHLDGADAEDVTRTPSELLASSDGQLEARDEQGLPANDEQAVPHDFSRETYTTARDMLREAWAIKVAGADADVPTAYRNDDPVTPHRWRDVDPSSGVSAKQDEMVAIVSSALKLLHGDASGSSAGRSELGGGGGGTVESQRLNHADHRQSTPVDRLREALVKLADGRVTELGEVLEGTEIEARAAENDERPVSLGQGPDLQQMVTKGSEELGRRVSNIVDKAPTVVKKQARGVAIQGIKQARKRRAELDARLASAPPSDPAVESNEAELKERRQKERESFSPLERAIAFGDEAHDRPLLDGGGGGEELELGNPEQNCVIRETESLAEVVRSTATVLAQKEARALYKLSVEPEVDRAKRVSIEAAVSWFHEERRNARKRTDAELSEQEEELRRLKLEEEAEQKRLAENREKIRGVVTHDFIRGVSDAEKEASQQAALDELRKEDFREVMRVVFNAWIDLQLEPLWQRWAEAKKWLWRQRLPLYVVLFMCVVSFSWLFVGAMRFFASTLLLWTSPTAAPAAQPAEQAAAAAAAAAVAMQPLLEGIQHEMHKQSGLISSLSSAAAHSCAAAAAENKSHKLIAALSQEVKAQHDTVAALGSRLGELLLSNKRAAEMVVGFQYPHVSAYGGTPLSAGHGSKEL